MSQISKRGYTLQIVALSACMCVSLTTSRRATAQATTATVPSASDSGELQEITVTAERRETSVQTTPIAISAVSGDALRRSSVVDLASLSEQIPNLNVGSNAGSAQVFIRGVGYNAITPGGETRVALYSDGIYLARTQGAFLGYYDVDRIEVLRGPQGTLYGRNATAGAINTITKEPGSSLDGFISETVGDFGLSRTEGAVGGPLSDILEGRVAFLLDDRNGYGKNITTNEPVNDDHDRNVRVKLKFLPTDNFFARVESDYSLENDHSAGYRTTGIGSPAYTYRDAGGALVTFPGVIPLATTLGFATPSNPQDAAGLGPLNRLETFGTSLDMEWKIASGTTFSSLTGFRRLNSSIETNSDGTSSNLTAQYIQESSTTLSQEFRVAQTLGDFGNLLVGAYYFHEHNSEYNRIAINPVAIGIGTAPAAYLLQGYATVGDVHTQAEAVFAQVDFKLTDKLGMTIGGRYSHELKTAFEGAELDFTRVFSTSNPPIFYGTQNDRLPLSRFDPKFTLDYKFTDSEYGYLTYSRGFKSGGFNLGALQAPFQPEVLTSYEAGLKSEFLDRTLRANLAAFFYKYSDLQVSGTVGNGVITDNADAHVKGVEAEITALVTPDLRIDLNMSYLDAKYTRYSTSEDARPYLGVENLAGNYLDQAPPYSVDLGMGYSFRTWLGNVTPRVNVVRTGNVYFSEFNRPNVSQPAWTKLNAYVNYELPGKGWTASLFGKNLTNKTYLVGEAVNAGLFGFPVSGQYGAPRTYGLQVAKSF